MPPLSPLDPVPTLQAHLGPTNTGKTHRAVQRMLARRTGMIGLPLRLLAREVFDRVVQKVGPEAVALITGEERVLPPRPRYWVCTVESMPVSRNVEFLAIDEIQLCTHPERGHVFTERLLHARGLLDTWFMGSDSMAPAIESLLPTCEHHRHPRLSSLRHAGECELSDLPPRSVVVAFSAQQVYEVAERLRRRRGGAAVVLGALSPRARNAQVEMYQSGEVAYMVATDAIGMGLNMDVDHVAFAALRKFDGRVLRDLEPGELAQVAGRAGRFTSDGTFGTLADAGPMDPRVAADIEQHRFQPVRRLVWRNHDLDTATVDTLLTSLRRRPRGRWFTALDHADDSETLERLAALPEIRARADSPERVALLWEVCQIPDFRKLLEGSHARLLTEVYTMLVDRGELHPDWLAMRLDRQDRTDGDIGALTTRIAFVRTWAYIANRRGWVPAPEPTQERTRAIEDRLSDALHERLTWRFVDHRVGAARARPRPARPVVPDTVLPGRRADPASPFAAMLAFDLPPDPRAEPAVPTGPSPGEVEFATAQAEALVGAEEGAFQLGDRLEILHEGQCCARISRGPSLIKPQAAVVGLGPANGRTRLRVQRRIQLWLDDQVALLLAPLHRKASLALSPAGRGLLYQVEAGLGLTPTAEAQAAIRDLAPTDLRALAKLGVRRGARFIYAMDMLKGDSVRWRAALWGALHERPDVPIPAGGTASVALQEGISPGYYATIGYPRVGDRVVRVDQLERALAHLRRLASRGDFEPPEELLSWLGLPRDALVPTIEALGGRIRADGRVAGTASRPPRRRGRRTGGRRRGGPPRRREEPEAW
ncbi:MAG: helicase-related protein [Myxococcota bacterium]|nr:helicase-related protein [Myxococcota bacterium]